MIHNVDVPWSMPAMQHMASPSVFTRITVTGYAFEFLHAESAGLRWVWRSLKPQV